MSWDTMIKKRQNPPQEASSLIREIGITQYMCPWKGLQRKIYVVLRACKVPI